MRVGMSMRWRLRLRLRLRLRVFFLLKLRGTAGLEFAQLGQRGLALRTFTGLLLSAALLGLLEGQLAHELVLLRHGLQFAERLRCDRAPPLLFVVAVALIVRVRRPREARGRRALPGALAPVVFRPLSLPFVSFSFPLPFESFPFPFAFESFSFHTLLLAPLALQTLLFLLLRLRSLLFLPRALLGLFFLECVREDERLVEVHLLVQRS
jgi:hypothetical protein